MVKLRNKMLINVDRFLEKYSNVILDDHKNLIIRYHTYLKKLQGIRQVLSKHGWHYTTCVWAYDWSIVGPNTCRCQYAKNYRGKLEEILDLYETNINK